MISFEAQLSANNSKITAFAVIVTICMTLITGALIVKDIMTPPSTVEVKLITVNEQTGHLTDVTTLAVLQKGRDKKEIQSNTALNKFWAQQFVTFFENYEHHSIRSDFEKVQLYSSEEVFAQYYAKFQGKSDIRKSLGKSLTQTVKILSITPESTTTPFLDTENGVTVSMRVVRQIKRGTRTELELKGVIRMTFGYDIEAKMDEKTRNLNPLGFMVTSYRFDAEQ